MTKCSQHILGEVHDLKAAGANHGELVLQELHAVSVCADEEFLVDAEPVGLLPKQGAERPTLSIVIGYAARNGFEHTEEGQCLHDQRVS